MSLCERERGRKGGERERERESEGEKDRERSVSWRGWGGRNGALPLKTRYPTKSLSKSYSLSRKGFELGPLGHKSTTISST